MRRHGIASSATAAAEAAGPGGAAAEEADRDFALFFRCHLLQLLLSVECLLISPAAAARPIAARAAAAAVAAAATLCCNCCGKNAQQPSAAETAAAAAVAAVPGTAETLALNGMELLLHVSAPAAVAGDGGWSLMLLQQAAAGAAKTNVSAARKRVLLLDTVASAIPFASADGSTVLLLLSFCFHWLLHLDETLQSVVLQQQQQHLHQQQHGWGSGSCAAKAQADEETAALMQAGVAATLAVIKAADAKALQKVSSSLLLALNRCVAAPASTTLAAEAACALI